MELKLKTRKQKLIFAWWLFKRYWVRCTHPNGEICGHPDETGAMPICDNCIQDLVRRLNGLPKPKRKK